MSAPTPTLATTPTPATDPNVPIDKAVLESPFIQEKAAKQLRVCCYGSSSSLTPVQYLEAAKSVGYILAKRGHTCVHGAGSFGCMAAMNEGAAEGNGHIVGVIHEMWLTEKEDSSSAVSVRDKDRVTLRDGAASGPAMVLERASDPGVITEIIGIRRDQRGIVEARRINTSLCRKIQRIMTVHAR